jgi:glutamate/tyrosine decarboxylase-like PLP-dependent enzyme
VIWKDCLVADPLGDRDQLDAALDLAATRAREYLRWVRDARVLSPDTEVAIERWSDQMPEEGDGTLSALTQLADRGREAATGSSGPRFFHFVMGGDTPAALAADWLTSVYDQPAYAWASSPFAARLEQIAIEWLRELFELPSEFGGVLTTGATMRTSSRWRRRATAGLSVTGSISRNKASGDCPRR